MEQHERTIIEGLFERLGQAQEKSAPRDQEAEALLRELLAKQPAAPYYMAQAILVQEHLLETLNAKVEELERERAERSSGGGFLGGLFGGGAKSVPVAQQPPATNTPDGGNFQRSSGGFLGGALQTAAAVAGGVLIGSTIAGFFAEEAEASEAPVEEKAEVATVEEGGFDDLGDDDF